MNKGTNKEVARAFANGIDMSNPRGTFRTENGKLFSYVTLVGFKLDDGTPIISSECFSPTTGKQLSLVKRHVHGCILVDCFAYGKQKRPTAAMICTDLMSQIKFNNEKARKARQRKDYYLQRVDELHADLRHVCSAMVYIPKDLPSVAALVA